MNPEYPGENYYGINSISKVISARLISEKQQIKILEESLKKRKNKKLDVKFEGD